MKLKTILALALAACLPASAILHAEDIDQKVAVTPSHPAFAKIKDMPGFPRVLLIGDSISIGYTLFVREELKGKANVHRAVGNCGPSSSGLAKLDTWLGDGKWDVVHFNFGLHDLKQMKLGERQVPPAEYEQNLRKIVEKLKTSGARLVFATTTPVGGPAKKSKYPRVSSDVCIYNKIALRVMSENGVAINDLHAIAKVKLADHQGNDGVHFNKDGSAALAKAVAASVRAALNNKTSSCDQRQSAR